VLAARRQSTVRPSRSSSEAITRTASSSDSTL